MPRLLSLLLLVLFTSSQAGPHDTDHGLGTTPIAYGPTSDGGAYVVTCGIWSSSTDHQHDNCMDVVKLTILSGNGTSHQVDITGLATTVRRASIDVGGRKINVTSELVDNSVYWRASAVDSEHVVSLLQYVGVAGTTMISLCTACTWTPVGDSLLSVGIVHDVTPALWQAAVGVSFIKH